MSYFSDCLEKFEKLPKKFKDQFGSLEVFEEIEKIETEFGVDLKFLVVLLAIGELSLEDIPEYLRKKYELAEEDAYEIRGILIDKIFKNARNSNLLRDNNSLRVLNSDELISFFREKMVKALSVESDKQDYIISVNKSIFSWLAKDGLFQEILSKNLLNNQERATSSKIIIDGRECDPTVANWIKDFINFHGSENFNDIVLAEYLVNSKNIRALAITEKDRIKQILKIYRNLTFFPDSMGEDVDNWLFIPVEIKNNDKINNFNSELVKNQDNQISIDNSNLSDVLEDGGEISDLDLEESLDSERLELTVPEVGSQSARVTFQNNIHPPSPAPEPRAPIKPSLADELEIMLKDYPEGSLEHKTIEQELKRLRQKK